MNVRNIRKIERADLPMLAELAKDKTIETRDDICFEHSKMYLSDDGEVVCFIVLRERSLIEFFNGNIPAVENFEKDKHKYLDEWWVKEDIEYFEEHYEIIATYLKEGVSEMEFSELLHRVEFEDRKPQIGIIWMINDPPNDADFYHFNNVVWIDIPRID